MGTRTIRMKMCRAPGADNWGNRAAMPEKFYGLRKGFVGLVGFAGTALFLGMKIVADGSMLNFLE